MIIVSNGFGETKLTENESFQWEFENLKFKFFPHFCCIFCCISKHSRKSLRKLVPKRGTKQNTQLVNGFAEMLKQQNRKVFNGFGETKFSAPAAPDNDNSEQWF